MDWTKAKNILIAALLVTNLFLISGMLYGNAKAEAGDSQFLANTVEVLKARNITIDAELPSAQFRMPVLSVEYDNADITVINELLSDQALLPDSQPSSIEAREMADRFIEACGLMTENVAFSSIDEFDNVFIFNYVDEIDGVAIEDSYMTCIVKDGKIESIDRLWLKPVELGKTKKLVIPIAQALIKFMSDNPENEDITIQDVKLVYWLDSVNFGVESPVSDTAFPAWKIVYNDGQVVHINAFEQ
jgi:regulatory protein YycI of two-component signal transduction system YycFG